MESRKILLAGVCRSPDGTSGKPAKFPVIFSLTQAFEIVFHNVVERPVDNHVYKCGKSATATLLDLIA
jgi:hypothetical protein